MSLAALALAVSLAGGSTFTSAVPAPDHRPCISKREFNGSNYIERRAYLENKWEVRGLGVPVDLPVMGRTVIYPRCGYSMDEAWYGIQYTTNRYGHQLAMVSVWWSAKDATPHGRP